MNRGLLIAAFVLLQLPAQLYAVQTDADLLASKRTHRQDSVSEAEPKKKRYWGQLTGSFETNTIYYLEDKTTGTMVPPDSYGSNNYLKLDYTYKGLSVGVQAEWYPQIIQGYDQELDGFAVPMKYISYRNRFMEVTVGDFYEQYGSGLLLRAWEDRTLGLNNSLGGARLAFNIKDILQIKALAAVPREYMSYSKTLLAGGDISFPISNALKLQNHYLAIEGSFLDKFEEPLEDHQWYDFKVPTSVISYSARLNYAYAGFSANFEYVGKGKDLNYPIDLSDLNLRTGNAQLVDLAYGGHGLSVNLALRRLKNMTSQIWRAPPAAEMTSNTVNYIPALTLLHTYTLASMRPYTPNADNELGGQLDMFYRIKKNTALGGKRGMKLHANFSTYYGRDIVLAESTESPLLYREFTFDLEKSWSKSFQTTIFYSYQLIRPYVPLDHMEERNVFVLDMLFKFSRRYSLRAEFQYLYGTRNETDWMGATLDFGMAPRWSFYVSDLYNHGDTKTHYYSAGVAYTHSIVRASLSYGRNKAGYVCSGGVCRLVPAYTGANLSVTISF